MKSKASSHLLFIDGIRALAALYVTIHHEVLQYYKIPTIYGFSFVRKNLFKFFLGGHYAVALFIVVSGYSLMISVSRHSDTLRGGALEFFRKRVIRILPPYYLAMALSLILIWTCIGVPTGFNWDNSLPVSSFDIVMHLLLLHDFLRPGAWHINHVFWSISVEWRIYFFFPVLVLLWRRVRPVATVFVSVLISLLGLGFLIGLSSLGLPVNFGEGVHPFIILFAFGMLAADVSLSPKAWSASFRERYASLPSWFRGVLFVVLGGLAVFVGRLDGPDRLLMPLSDITAGAFFALCIFALAVGGDGFFRRVVGCKPLVWVGTFSYSLYLIHAPLLQVATQYGLDTWASSLDLRVGLLVFVGTPVIVGLAWLFFLVCEKPFIKMNQRVRKPVALEVVTDPAP